MSDRLFFPLVALIALALILVSLVWPQGLGAPSPAPVGHPMAPIHQDAPAATGVHSTQTAADGPG